MPELSAQMTIPLVTRPAPWKLRVKAAAASHTGKPQIFFVASVAKHKASPLSPIDTAVALKTISVYDLRYRESRSKE